jgi:phage baseplate assembly protein W
VNRPDFGAGLAQLVFAPNSVELASSTQFLAQGALQQWLGNLLTVLDVTVEADEATLRVTVSYALVRSEERRTATFQRSLAP